jgi:hypothetical protein
MSHHEVDVCESDYHGNNTCVTVQILSCENE